MFDQVMILLLGPLAIWMTQDKRDRIRKWACIIGLASQPFWFHSAWEAGMWGIFLAHFAYLYSWLRGYKLNWYDKERKHD
jgi:hypothetical protein